MVIFRAAALSLLALTPTSAFESLRHRRLSYELIAGYEPKSLVTDHNALDLDQKEIESQLAKGTDNSFEIARAIYENGAFSKSIAYVSVQPLQSALRAGAQVTGKATDGQEVVGTVYEDYPAGTTRIGIQYQAISIQSDYVGCQVGANPTPNIDGCFADNGGLMIEGMGNFTYSYNQLEDTKNGRNIAGFSKDAEAKMYRCDNCPYPSYKKFYEYYGEFDYGDKWVTAAFDGIKTNFENGNADFSQYGFEGRTEAIKKGTAYMNVWMYVIREMEDALDDCKSGCTIDGCNDDPVHAWDEAVAFYSGSLEGRDGSDSGVFLHQLADKRCQNFRTCGDLANEATGISHVNLEIFREFNDGQRKLLNGLCTEARANKERIEALMAVPLVQGTIRYAYITDVQNDASEKSEAEGAVFAAAVLPLVNACDEEAAATIYNNMRVGQYGSASFGQVKHAFEKVYTCMNIRCEDVGGLYESGAYLQGAHPCGTSQSSKNSANTGLIVGLSIAGVIIFALLGVIFCRQRSQIEYPTASSKQAADETEETFN